METRVKSDEKSKVWSGGKGIRAWILLQPAKGG